VGSFRHNAGVVHPLGVPGRLTPFATAAPSLHYFWSSSRRLFAAGSAQVSTPGFDLQRLDEAFVRLQVRHNEAYPRKQLLKVKLHLGHHPARCLPTRGLVQKALVPNHGLVARSAYRPSTAPSPSYRWMVCGWPAPRRSPAWRKRRQHGTPPPCRPSAAVRSPAAVFSALGAVHVAGTQLRCQPVTLAVEQQQGVIAGRSKCPLPPARSF